MAQKVTLQDIADELGLSRATVSKAFNNSKQVSEETRNKIFQKAMEMGYKEFSYFANSQHETELTTIQKKITPATNKSNIDLFLGNHITSSHFFSNVQEDIMSQLNSLGYQLNIHYVSRQNLQNRHCPTPIYKNYPRVLYALKCLTPSIMTCSVLLDCRRFLLMLPQTAFKHQQKPTIC